MTINEAMSSIQAKIDAIDKSQTHQKGYKFRGIEDFLNTLHPLLTEFKVNVYPEILNYETGTKLTKMGAEMDTCTAIVKYRFVAEDGTSQESTAVGKGLSTDGKEMGIAMKDAYKSCLETVFSIPTVGQQVAAENGGYAEDLRPKERKSSATAPPADPFGQAAIDRLISRAKKIKTWEGETDSVEVVMKYLKSRGYIAKGLHKSIVLAARDAANTHEPKDKDWIKNFLMQWK